MKLILIRHGESEGNVNASAYFAKHDSLIELTEKGKQQALDVGKYLDESGVVNSRRAVYIYCSPYKRARDTAILLTTSFTEASGQKGDGPIPENVLLREQEYPDFKSHRERDIFLLRRKNCGAPFFFKENGSESFCDVVQRVETFLTKLKQNVPRDAQVVIVTHQVVIRSFIMVLDNKPYEEHYIDVGNCEPIVREL